MKIRDFAQALNALPPHYLDEDMETITMYGDRILIVHAEHPPQIWEGGSWMPISWSKDATPLPTFHQGRLVMIDGKRVYL